MWVIVTIGGHNSFICANPCSVFSRLMAIIPLYVLIPVVYSAYCMLSVPAWGLECVQNVMCVVYISMCVHMTNTAFTGVWP